MTSEIYERNQAMAQEVEVVDDNGIPMIVEGKEYPVDKIPSAVKDCVVGLGILQKKIDAAVQRSDSARRSANSAANVKLAWYRIGDKTEAIEALQSAVSSQSNAMFDQSEAMLAMLEYQKAITHAMQFLLGLGVSSIANNRAVYNAVKAEIQNCSEEELSELAKQELKNTLAQLQSQQDILRKQEETHEKTKQNRAAIKKINEIDEQQERELARQRNKDEEHDQRLDEQAIIIKNLQKEIAELKGEEVEDVALRTAAGTTSSWTKTQDSDDASVIKWYRSSDEKIIAGICSGFAHKFGMNAWVIRVVLIVITCFCFFLPIIYIVLMFILKGRPTKTAAY